MLHTTPSGHVDSSHPSSRLLHLFLANGIPTGLVVAEIGNWSGKVLAAPRGKLGELLKPAKPLVPVFMF
jgi:hypothetical protein